MTLYFLSPVPAALRLNGQYVGVIDCFERRVEAQGDLLAEITPSDNGLPLCFMINGDFFAKPPEFAEVYLIGSDALIKLRAYRSSDAALRVLCQARLGACLFTLYSQGGIFVSCDGEDFFIKEMGFAFRDARFIEQSIGGQPVMCLFCEGALAVFSARGKMVFRNRVQSYSCGDMLRVTINFDTCAGCESECDFSFDGEEMKLISGHTRETRPVGEEVIHFAFFESVLARGDYKNTSATSLFPKRTKLRDTSAGSSAFSSRPASFTTPAAKSAPRGLYIPRAATCFPSGSMPRMSRAEKSSISAIYPTVEPLD